MFIVSRPQPSATKYSSAAAIASAADCRGRTRRRRSRNLLVDAHALPHRFELGVALHSPSVVELDVERHEVEPLEGGVVADGHDVVEAVHADPAPAGAAGVFGDVRAGPVDEDLFELRRSVLADVARLAREDDQRVAVRGNHDVGVAMDDLEPREVRHRAFETGVLAA